MGSLRSYTYKEIQKHNRADDCWLAIRDKVYDVTRFVPHHPGGNMIYLNAGRESTHLFESYHPSHVKFDENRVPRLTSISGSYWESTALGLSQTPISSKSSLQMMKPISSCMTV